MLGSGGGRRRRRKRKKKATIPSAQIELRGFDDSLRVLKKWSDGVIEDSRASFTAAARLTRWETRVGA
uniref:Uncharacterized protein n=1 Tax=Oryza punctata TaxID=4537 RepID=A0A0E0M1A3_ORYPU